MLNFLRKKIQSLTQTQQNIITAILILINVGVVIFWISFFISVEKPTSPKIEEKPSLVEQIPEPLKPGQIGEIPEKEAKEKEILPLRQIVFNTSGTILEVKEASLLVQGSGTNFADHQPRKLTLIFTDSTLTLRIAQDIKYQGLEGLKHLKEGMQVSIEGNENIRGKTKFEVRRLFILEI